MPKRFLKRYLPDSDKIKQHKALRFLGRHLTAPDLWHLNRRSVTNAVTIGLFIAFIPVPGQMGLAAIIAIFIRAYLPLSVALVWVTNPVTMGPLFYFAYLIGSWMLNQPSVEDFSYTESMLAYGWHNASALLAGCFVLGVVSSAFGNMGIRLFWRILVSRNWSRRKQSRLLKKMSKNREQKN